MPALSPHARSALRAGLLLFAFGVAYFLAFFYLLATRFVPSVFTQNLPAPFFLPEGVILAALLLSPRRQWCWYLLTAVAIELTLFTALHYPLWWILMGAVPDTLEPLLAALLLARLAVLPPRFASQREVTLYVGSLTIAALVAALLGGVQHLAAGNGYWSSVWPWFLGAVLANLVLAPTIVLWLTTDVRLLWRTPRARLAEAALLGIAVLCCGAVMIFGLPLSIPITASALLYVPVPVLIWAAVRFGPRGLVTAQSLITIFALASAWRGVGPFLSSAAYVRINTLQLFFLAICLPLLFLAAVTQERAVAVSQLHESEKRFHAAFASAAVGMALVDLAGHPLEVNRALVAMLGYTEEEVRTHAIGDFTFLQDAALNLTPFDQTVAGAIDQYQMEKRYRHKDGHLVWGHLSAGVVRDASGQPLYLVGHIQDITNRKRAEEALRVSQEFQTLAEHSPDLIARVDREGHFRYLNQAGAQMLRLLGMTAEEWVGKTVAELRMSESIAGGWDHAVCGAVATGEPQTMDTELGIAVGCTQYLHARFVPELADDGTVRSVLAIATDFSALKQAEARLAEQTSQLEAIFNAIADGVGVYDAQGCFVRANTALQDLYGFAADADFTDLTLAERAERLLVFDTQGKPLPADQWPHLRVLGGEHLIGANALDTRIQTLDGREVWVSTTGAPIHTAEGQVTGVVLISRDITARRELEQRVQEQASQLEATFAAMSDGVAVFTQYGHLLRANQAWLDMFRRIADLRGLSADPTFAALPLTEQVERFGQIQPTDEHGHVIPLEAIPSVRALQGETITGESAVDERIETPDGRVFHVSVTGAAVRDATGNITGAVVVSRDVTARRQLEQRLAQRERQYRTLVEHSPDIITRFDRSLRQLYVSPNAVTILGIPAHERIGKTYAELGVPQSIYAQWERALTEVFATEEPQVLDVTSPYGSAEDQTYYYRIRYIPEFDADGSVESVLGISTNVTELRQTEQALRAATAAAEAARQEEERRRHEAERREEIAESLRGVLAVLNSNRSLKEVLDHVVRQVEHLLGSEAAAIFGMEPESVEEDGIGQRGAKTPPAPRAETLILQAAHGLRLARRQGQTQPHRPGLPFAYAAVQRALESRQPVAVERADEHEMMADPAEEGVTNDTAISIVRGALPAPYQALLVVPIRVVDAVYGCLLLFSTTLRRFQAEEVALSLAYADQAGLAIANARLQAHIEEEATVTERNRLARELHDTVTQEIFSASLLAESIPRNWQAHRAAAEASLQQLHGLTRGALAGLRVLLLELRPTELERMPLAQLLRQLGAALSSRAGVPIAVEVGSIDGHDEDGRASVTLPVEVKVALYRLAQEALTNAVKHAAARMITVHLHTAPTGGLVLEIEDNGLGFDPEAIPSGHLGLAMLCERAQAVGATVRLRSRRGQGTVVRVEWRLGGTGCTSGSRAPDPTEETGDERTRTRARAGARSRVRADSRRDRG
jgi:PAS domain S-box-containing protein